MSSYRDKYHLNKVQPVKNRSKAPTQLINKPAPKVEKSNVLQAPPKRKIRPHQPYFTHGHVHTHSTTSQEHLPAPPSPLLPQNKLQKHRSDGTYRSLQFRSLKEISTGNAILNKIQGFFRDLLESEEGCNCAEPCPEGSRLFKWVDVPLQIIKKHYTAINAKWKNAIEQDQAEEEQDWTKEIWKNYKQIQKDILRTQSERATFRNLIFRQRMMNILMSYAVQDPKVGYVQGMNLVLSGVLYHVKDEIKAYAVLRKLVYSIRGIYLHDFEECRGHTAKLKTYLTAHVHDLSLWLQQLCADLDMICLPWFISLMACLVPLQSLHLIYSGFTTDKWQFIYRVALSLFIYLKPKLLQCQDAGEVSVLFSSSATRSKPLDWQDIILFSNSITL